MPLHRREFMRSLSGLAVPFVSFSQSEASSAPLKAGSVPVIHCTDLFHPPDDPDDHVDLATLFALPEFDIRAVILDLGLGQWAKPGDLPVKQMMELTGRKVRYASGLANCLRYPEDKASDQQRRFQSAVDLILQVLKESKEQVCIVTVGSVRDIMAAFNREPELFREKVARIYPNMGNSSGGELFWNPRLDPQAYLRLTRSGLPIHWCPCFGGPEPCRNPLSLPDLLAVPAGRGLRPTAGAPAELLSLCLGWEDSLP